MNPYQHGEVFVLDDGSETDLDLGHYERFIDENMSKDNNATAGQIYSTVLDKDRIDSLIEKARDTAQHYTRRFIEYMNFNQSTFPEYTSNSNGDVSPDDVADFGGWVL